MSTPQTVISICSGIGVDNSYTHALWFNVPHLQSEFFLNKVVKRFTDYTYCRHKWNIKVNASYGEARNWEYLYFKNPSDDKTYYYFITSVEYKSDTMVELHLEMDVIQTYIMQWDLKPCFIERMTPRSDEIGENTIDEGLEVGDYTNNGFIDIDSLETLVPIVMASQGVNIDGTPGKSNRVREVHNVMTANYIYVCANDKGFKTLLTNYETAGITDTISTVWLFPKKLINPENYSWDELETESSKGYDHVGDIINFELYLNAPSDLNGYEPRNKKLFTYPYNFIYITNNSGGCASYKYERFTDKSYSFYVDGSPFPDGGIKITPINYNGASFNHDEGLTLSNYPTIAYSGDYYKIWLAQNQNSYNANFVAPIVSTVGGAGAVVGGFVTGNPVMAVGGVGGVVGGISQINTLLAQKKDAQAQPNQARGIQSPALNVALDKQTFSVYKRMITPEYARIIDDYFTMYGYKQNIVAKPSIRNRQLFTYIKTVGCSVGGNIPNEDRIKIASIFDKGVTFWTDPEKVGAYDETNGFLT